MGSCTAQCNAAVSCRHEGVMSKEEEEEGKKKKDPEFGSPMHLELIHI